MNDRTSAPNFESTLTELLEDWTIRITFPMLNLAVLTLVNPDGEDAHIKFVTGPGGGPDPLTVTTLSEIQDPVLHSVARAALAEYTERVADANKSVAKFNAAVPPTRLRFLTTWLADRRITASFTVDSDKLAVALELKAAGEAAGVLLTLVGRWREWSLTPTDRITTELDEDTLEAQLGQDEAVQFLTWLSETEIGY